MLHSQRLNMCILLLCSAEAVLATLRDPKMICCEYARPKKDMLRNIATHFKSVHNSFQVK